MLVLAALATCAPAPATFAPVASPLPQSAADADAGSAETDDYFHSRREAREAGLRWLAAFQDADGRWDCRGFAKNARAKGSDGGGKDDDAFWKDEWLDRDPVKRTPERSPKSWTSSGGVPLHDIGVSGLALLALMADGSTRTEGEYADTIGRGLDWLRSQQDAESGLIGKPLGHTFLYNHGIASLALVEALSFETSEKARDAAQKAMSYIARARNPYAVWRYEVPPNGDNDTSVSTWMTLATVAAKDAGLKVDREALVAAINWFDEMTDPRTGRCGYNETGSPSSRVPGQNDEFPTDVAETLTAAALLCRIEIGQQPREQNAIIDHVRLLLRTLPDAPPERIDDALWILYGMRATSRLGGRPWSRWQETFVPTIVRTQAKDGPAAGSWDPTDAWGFSMGRVGTTALMAWTLASIDGR
ncbi:MAG: hypothetical protein AAGI22_24085 [Planctomycetota bacterium]